MKYLFAPNKMSESSDVYTLKMFLEEKNISCLIRNEHLSMAAGELPMQEFPELWVMNDADFPRAYKLVKAWRSSPVDTHGPWLCSDCGETIEGQFTSCWKCGRQREEA